MRITSTPGAVPQRLPFIDLVRALASHAIVWHHLAFYGPLSDTAYPLLPGVIDFLYAYARMAVQIFFVIGGFFTARALAGVARLDLRILGKLIALRYRRVGFPYLAALWVAILANTLADRWMDHESISAAPSLDQLLAHVVFLQDLLGYEHLTAGIWYIAVDFQLVILTLVLGALCGQALRLRPAAPVDQGFVLCAITMAGLALASLFFFNRDARYDSLAVYFFAAYFLGMVLYWSLQEKVSSTALFAYAGLVALVGLFDGRPRLLVAVGTAVVIYIAARRGFWERWPNSRLSSYMGRISYSLFLVHFPVCLVINAFLSRFTLSPGAALAGMVAAYLVSVGVGALFYRVVERPCVGAKR
ncbi:MAG: acyltransferase [Deltaproteobacteria bacterium]|nr:acyltransferase [Deltaproteobacteria bacterium]